MSHFLLIHGAWHCGACWHEVIRELDALGHTAEAIDLPGHGASPVPPEQVGLADYAAAVAERLGEETVLVGHSMGGIAISAAAELAPEQVKRLVFVAAFLPRDGQSLVDLVKLGGGLAIRKAIGPGPAEGTTALDPTAAAPFLYHDASDEQAARARAWLCAQPNRPQTEKVGLSEDRFGSIPRDYLLCTEDRTIAPDLQRLMLDASACAQVTELATGHFPQLTAPKALARQLADLAP